MAHTILVKVTHYPFVKATIRTNACCSIPLIYNSILVETIDGKKIKKYKYAI
jgi:hypothetical protein